MNRFNSFPFILFYEHISCRFLLAHGHTASPSRSTSSMFLSAERLYCHAIFQYMQCIITKRGYAYEPVPIGCIHILFISITHTPPPMSSENAHFSRYFSHFFAYKKKTESAMDSARRIGSMFHVGIIQSTTVQSFSVFLMYLSCNVKKSLIIT